MIQKLLITIYLLQINPLYCQQYLDKMLMDFRKQDTQYIIKPNPLDCSFDVKLVFPDSIYFDFQWKNKNDVAIFGNSTCIKTFDFPVSFKIIAKDVCVSSSSSIFNYNPYHIEIIYPEKECEDTSIKITNLDTQEFDIYWYNTPFNKSQSKPIAYGLCPSGIEPNKDYILQLMSKSTGCTIEYPFITDMLYKKMHFQHATIQTNGCKDGSASILLDSLSVIGGRPPYSYYWSTNDLSQSLEKIDIGSYVLTVTDQSNCVIFKKFNVSPENEYIKKVELEHYNKSKAKFGKIHIEPKQIGNEYPFIDWLAPKEKFTNAAQIDDLIPGTYCAFITYEKSLCSFEVCYEILDLESR